MSKNSEYFLNVATAISLKSKDPSTKVGCVITDADNAFVSAGYNGMVKGCNEEELWLTREMKLETVIHAEENALLFSRRDLKGCVLYCTHAPCNKCLRLILQSGIRRIYYRDSSLIVRASPIANLAVMKLIRATGAEVYSSGKRKAQSVFASEPLSLDVEIEEFLNEFNKEILSV